MSWREREDLLVMLSRSCGVGDVISQGVSGGREGVGGVM